MRADFIVMLSLLFDHGLGIGSVPKPSHRQPFILELPVETFSCAVLPRLAGVGRHHVEILVGSPAQKPTKYDFQPLVRTRDLWRTMRVALASGAIRSGWEMAFQMSY